MPATPTNSELAARFRCSVRTISRLKANGVTVSDPAAVAAALAMQRNLSPKMTEAVLIQLETITQPIHD